jgi:hypothetical protein
MRDAAVAAATGARRVAAAAAATAREAFSDAASAPTVVGAAEDRSESSRPGGKQLSLSGSVLFALDQ